ncbi:FAD-binding oxidoreductase [Sulfitobacter sp. S190]|uniref:FAD-binding oxidoreductase n=1 Tax=Sulfitobacter sp. S190 TaxID=2867022 RepID=UPI0021A2E860|nr:FAD-binding oxidoreductase [Sulfitobacter sp. S190]UWR24306.1 FAD-binding oxidoreductase [Sulfitobacter sp. S190]
MNQAHFDTPDPQVLGEIKNTVGLSGWKVASEAPQYFEDPRGRFRGLGCLIVLPDTTQQVAEIVRLCNDARIGIVPYSGGTGVVAGQLSDENPNVVILSLERMNTIRDMQIDEGVMVVEAGCILENVHDAAAQHDMAFPLSMASKGSCCIGGNLATNAGGIQVLRYGNARDLCLGIEAVLPDGTVLQELAPLRKNNTGYDLRHLLIGSEGTLGIITAAALRLVPQDPETGTAFLAIRAPSDGLSVYRTLKTYLGDSISGLELMSGMGIALVTEKFPDLRNPFDQLPPWALLLEATGAMGLSARIEEALQACFEAGLIVDAVIAQSAAQRKSLWDLRENTPEANRMAGAFCNSDTSVPLGKMDAFIADTVAKITGINPGLRINSYGHIGDGNIHHNVFPPDGVSKETFIADNPAIIDQVRTAVNDVTHAHGGSISAEHGVGRLKTADLENYATAARLGVLKQIKAALDPNNIMNPGALIR